MLGVVRQRRTPMLTTRARLRLVLQGHALGLLFWGGFPRGCCFLAGRADCGRSERCHSHLGPENRPQRAADSRARGFCELGAHRPRCQLHGGRQQLGELRRPRPWAGMYGWAAPRGQSSPFPHPVEFSCAVVGRREPRLLWGGGHQPGHKPPSPRRETATCGT